MRVVGRANEPRTPGWLLDELASAGRENLDPGHVERYDRKMNARAADEVTICHEPGLGKLDQDLAALRRQRQKADRDDVEDNEIAFLNARHRCGENRGCIEQSYRNRIQEFAQSLSEQGHERSVCLDRSPKRTTTRLCHLCKECATLQNTGGVDCRDRSGVARH